MDELQMDGNPHDFDYEPPEWATCGNCDSCRDVFDYTGTLDDARCGACVVDEIGIVMREWSMRQAPCGGETWSG